MSLLGTMGHTPTQPTIATPRIAMAWTFLLLCLVVSFCDCSTTSETGLMSNTNGSGEEREMVEQQHGGRVVRQDVFDVQVNIIAMEELENERDDVLAMEREIDGRTEALRREALEHNFLDPTWADHVVDRDSLKYVPLMDLPAFRDLSSSFPAEATTNNTLFVSGYWQIGNIASGVVKKNLTDEQYWLMVEETLESAGKTGTSLYFIADSRELCDRATLAYDRTSEHTKQKFACAAMPYDQLPFEREASVIDPKCPTKFGGSVGSGVMTAYNRFWLAKMFVISNVARGHMPAKFRKRFEFISWVDAGRHWVTVERFKPFVEFVDGVRGFSIPSSDVVSMIAYDYDGGIDKLPPTEIMWLAANIDWRLPRVGALGDEVRYFWDSTCGEPIVNGAIILGHPQGILNLYAKYLDALEHMYQLTKRAMATGIGCKCFDEEMIFATTFVQCPSCFNLVGRLSSDAYRASGQFNL
eukprot:TRINITY_DN9284_c0_g1_i1.p1 TRINITY_DN9284_c0_g1~~TRINITY_DN9284_c0_g1_i1.p1  ORF type:complete len:469 (+),score=65.20 TRINITY_DN9284_c0_g1_i1:475-1881(+)